ncbi:MAG: GH92 family glycosyl hydrolase [Bacteroidales bacterium]
MKRKLYLLFLILFSVNATHGQNDFTEYIDPTIGTVPLLLRATHPNIHLPNQMVIMRPVKEDFIPDQVEEYPLPASFNMRVTLGELTDASWNQRMTIDHDLEVYHPWYYSTYLIEDDIQVSFTPGEKCFFYKIEFPETEKKNILIRYSEEAKINNKEGTRFISAGIATRETRGPNPVTREMDVFVFGEITDEYGQLVKDADIQTENGKYSISLDKDGPSKVLVKAAVSYISPQQAKINFEREFTSTSFDEFVNRGKKQWEKVINKIQVEGGTEAQKRTFYTSLYRTHIRMVDINEGGNYYSGYDGKVHESDRPFYVNDAIWDTYRTTHPLRTILSPEMEEDMLNSYVLMFEQSGSMPTFPGVMGNRRAMNCYHTAISFIDGYRKGLRDYDVEKAYEGIRKNLTKETLIPWRQGAPRLWIDDFYDENGFVPGLHPGQEETEPMVDDFESRQSVAVTLGLSYDAWALSELARELGKEEDAEIFSAKAKNYNNLWHPDVRLFMPKDDKGEWIMINPKFDGGTGFRDYYDENNGWTYAWDVQQDIDGLTGLLGGKKAADKRLDQLFREPLGTRKYNYYVSGRNATGLVGQFAMGNEPGFHIPYLYNYFGAPWKTQKRTRFLLDTWFPDNPFGLPGDEDGGAMTAFVVLSYLGIYPVTPGLPTYAISSPIFEKATIHLENGNDFTIIADGASKKNKYIQKAFINGKEINSPFITHEQIMSGATLELVLSDFPNKEWGKDAVPPNIW